MKAIISSLVAANVPLAGLATVRLESLPPLPDQLFADVADLGVRICAGLATWALTSVLPWAARAAVDAWRNRNGNPPAAPMAAPSFYLPSNELQR